VGAALVAPPTPGRPADVLLRYQERFAALGLKVNQSEEDRLRALYVTLYELGVRETDGRYFKGADRGPNKTKAERQRLERWEELDRLQPTDPQGKRELNEVGQQVGAETEGWPDADLMEWRSGESGGGAVVRGVPLASAAGPSAECFRGGLRGSAAGEMAGLWERARRGLSTPGEIDAKLCRGMRRADTANHIRLKSPWDLSLQVGRQRFEDSRE